MNLQWHPVSFPVRVPTYSEEDQVEAMNDLWRNFCVSDAYEPGSTAKPFTVAAGLETGTLTGNESYYCGGSKDVRSVRLTGFSR